MGPACIKLASETHSRTILPLSHPLAPSPQCVQPREPVRHGDRLIFVEPAEHRVFGKGTAARTGKLQVDWKGFSFALFALHLVNTLPQTTPMLLTSPHVSWFKQAEANLKKEAASLTKEKELMARTSPANHDLIHLNVGGTVLTTRRSTLTQVHIASILTHSCMAQL